MKRLIFFGLLLFVVGCTTSFVCECENKEVNTTIEAKEQCIPCNLTNTSYTICMFIPNSTGLIMEYCSTFVGCYMGDNIKKEPKEPNYPGLLDEFVVFDKPLTKLEDKANPQNESILP
jgi:hypothetical protein